MGFCWVTLPVRDFKKSLDFYHGVLGLPIDSKHERPEDGMEMVMLGEKDKPKVELIFFPEHKTKEFSSSVSVGIAVDSLEKAMEHLKENNIPVLRGPISPNPSIRFFYVLDPNGYEVQLVEIT